MPPADDRAASLRDLVGAGRFADALRTFREIDGPGVRRQPALLLLAATAATRLGDLEVARPLADGALSWFRTRGDRDGQMRALNLLGVIGFEQGRLNEAEEAFHGALALARELGDSLLAARASNNLASLSHLRGQANEALSLYRGALLSYQRLGDRRGAAETYHNLGLVFRDMAHLDEAENASVEAERHAELVGESALLALAVTGRAEVHLDAGEIELAEREVARAVRLAHAADDPLGGAEARRVGARAALRRRDLTVAVRESEAAYAIAGEHGAAVLQADCAAVLALALRANGNPAAEERRRQVLTTYRALGASPLVERFEREWASLG
ncbi:MAG TPA: tetratricopeptide repeat protein [Gemmatimonadales bacterium]